MAGTLGRIPLNKAQQWRGQQWGMGVRMVQREKSRFGFDREEDVGVRVRELNTHLKSRGENMIWL